MVNINKYIKAFLHPAGGHQGSHQAHQAGNQVNSLSSTCALHLGEEFLFDDIQEVGTEVARMKKDFMF